jgi:hypothetical protein
MLIKTKELLNFLKIKSSANIIFAKAGVLCFYESEVLNSNFVHLMKFSAKNPRLRKAAKRCATLLKSRRYEKTENFSELSLRRIPFS